MYFAENPAVAKAYALTIPKNINKEAYDAENIAKRLFIGGFDEKYITNRIKSVLPNADDKIISNAVETAKTGQVGGNLYKVDIPDADIPMMLDYDKPLLQQPPNVLKALQSVDDPYIQQAITTKPKLSKDGEYWEYMGNTYASKSEALEDATPQRIISGYTGLGKNPQEVSQALGQYGIKGVKYLDQSSRIDGKGTSNFVVFDPSNVKILEQNSKPMTRKEIIEQELKKVVE
jgi:hypothetical protein